MNSFFEKLIGNRSIDEHDNRPLWQYNLADDEYNELKKHLNQVERNEIDARDITLYYAEWWKNKYNGGFPKKQTIYSSLCGCRLSCDEFYDYAKRGAVLLGIPWIQRQNRLYFRTLLMQGGLPINHMLNNSSTYTKFLEKVLEINPSTIEEFMYDNDIVGDLPFGSRNEAIYESCLLISRALHKGDEQYLGILEAQKNVNGSRITQRLRTKIRELVNNPPQRSPKIKAEWILLKEIDQNDIKLNFKFPDIIEKSAFSELLQIKEEELMPEYNLIIEDILVCKFRQNIKGSYKVVWFNNSKVLWNGEETKPEIYLSTQDCKRFKFPILMVDNPKLSEPTLWTKIEEDKWKLEQGKYCKDEKGIVLFPKNWQLFSENGVQQITLFENTLNWIEFDKSINLKNENEEIAFATNATSFDWFVMESKPNWIVKSNMPIVSKAPQIIAYRKNGEKIESIKKFWRFSGDIVWQNWNITNLRYGCIEFKIEALGCQETGVFYNIGNFSLDFGVNNQNQNIAQISVENSNNLSFQIKDNELYSVDIKEADFILTLNDLRKGVKTIPVIINNQLQRRSLHLEIVSPFQGAQILSPKGDVLENETTILLQNLLGYRVVSQQYRNRYFVKLYNTQKEHIKIFKILSGNIVPLREYENIASKLYRLTDAMDKETAVAFELYN